MGVDLSEDALRFCRSRGVQAARASVLALPFGAGAFDLVTSFDVLYHRWVDRRPRRRGASWRGCSRPGGLLLVRVPALKMLWGAHDDAVLSRHRYTRGEVAALLRGAGLDVLELTYANTLLFPVLAAAPHAGPRCTGRHGSDVVLPARAGRGGVPRPAARAKRAWCATCGCPSGASVLALGRKPEVSEAAPVPPITIAP